MLGVVIWKHINYLQYQLVLKNNRKTIFHPSAPVLKYHQKSSNSCCLSSLLSTFYIIGDDRDVTDLVNFVEESLTLQTDKFSNIVHFDNSIMTNRMHIKGEQHLRYNLKTWHKKYAFDILKKKNECFTLVQLMELLGYVNHAISIVGYSIFGSNYNKALCLTQ